MPGECSDQPAASDEIPPQSSYQDGLYLIAKDGSKLKRWGSVKDACKIYFCCKTDTMRELIACKLVDGRKMNPTKRNSPYKVDLLSVWKLRTGEGDK